MKITTLGLLAAFVLLAQIGIVTAADPAEEYRKAMAAAQERFSQAAGLATTKYVATLKESLIEETKKGNLEGAIAIRDQIKLLEKQSVAATNDESSSSLQGEWECIAGEENGKPQDPNKVRQERRRLVISRNSLIMEKVGSSWVGKFEIDPKSGHFDLIGKRVPGNNLTEWIGIYEVNGDELKLCFIFNKEDKAKRPTEFKSQPPSQPGLAHAFYTFKRDSD
ncbi:TIGR03067 domain-containing protein [uncultured Gimesia sp.]|uniref:TIGR03067 domain-containing protein n=1 Tax=uncultured Gimesia sp. TaxID=1678688 RepID=UPI0026232F2A|nr:TIGR03067 domain-containing protein [uncultured Gimesia sp.]